VKKISTAYEALVFMQNNPNMLMRWGGYIKTCESFDKNECMDVKHPMDPTQSEVSTNIGCEYKPIWTKITEISVNFKVVL